MALGDLLSGVVGAANAQVEVRSNVLPPINLDLTGSTPDTGGPAGGISGFLLSLIKPSIRMQTDFGTKVIEPYGSPSEGTWIFVATAGAVVALAVGALAIYGAVRLVKS